MADAAPLARLRAVSLALAAVGAGGLAPAAVASELSWRETAVRPAEFGESPVQFSPASAFEALKRQARQRLSAKAGGSAMPSAMDDRPLCEWLAAWAETIVAATEDPSLPLPSADEAIASGTLVDLPDAALRKAVEEALGKASGDPIVRGEMATLRTLNSETGVQRLTGIEHAVNLRRLCLVKGQISDLGPLAGMTSLRRLHLRSNAIADVSPLGRLAQLTVLDLDRNDISDARPLADLGSLKMLDLARNEISDVAPLAGLRSLTWLDLDHNDISDVAPLAGLKSLKTLDLDWNRTSDVAPLAGLTALTVLYLGDNGISDVAALAGLKSLTTVGLRTNAISDVAPLAGLPSLTSLNLTGNEIADLGPLAETKSLRTLALGRNRISDVAALAGLTSLRVLELQENELASVEHLSGLTSLTFLSLNDNEISAVAPLAGLTSLRSLHLGRNAISDVAPLGGLKSLQKLTMYRNRIADVSPLAGLTSLQYLFLFDNAIADMLPLEGLRSLTWLYLDNNRLTTLVPKVFEKLPHLTVLGLAGNQLSALPSGFFTGAGRLLSLTLDDNPGAPFVIEAVPVLATMPRQRPARVAVRIAEGAPVELDVALRVVGGRPEAGATRMAAGALLSDALTVWPAGRGPVLIQAEVPELPTSYVGIALGAGSPLTLNGLAEYSDLDEPAEIDLASAFPDFDGAPFLAYATRTSDPAVAAADRTGNVLRIVPRGPGMATITVTATAADGRTVTRVFDITVPGAPPLRGWRWKLLEGS